MIPVDGASDCFPRRLSAKRHMVLRSLTRSKRQASAFASGSVRFLPPRWEVRWFNVEKKTLGAPNKHWISRVSLGELVQRSGGLISRGNNLQGHTAFTAHGQRLCETLDE